MLTDQQKEAVETIGENVLVSAGAGSGKTHVLVERYVEILRKSSSDPSLANIIAVTFTRKAASEMRSRLKAKFLSLSKDPDEVKRGHYTRWLGCLSEVDSARIVTINSLCDSIIRSYPADSGVDPEFEALDELASSQLIDEAIKEALRDVIAEYEQKHNQDGETSWEYALLLGFQIENIKEYILRMVRQSNLVEQALSAMPDPGSEEFAAHAQKFIDEVKAQELASLCNNRSFKQDFEYARGNPFTDPKNKLETNRQEITSLCQQIIAGSSTDSGAGNVEPAWQALTCLGAYPAPRAGGDDPGAVDLRKGLKRLRDLAKDTVEKIPASLGPEDDRAANLTGGIISLYRRVQVIYAREKHKRNGLDFNDQISYARICLEKAGSQARAYFNEKVKALLVDEFQDTNDVQANLLTLLAGPDTRAFLIGDDKQSIYKFQGADVATFNRWRLAFANQKSVLTGKSRTTKLNKSFRSHPSVVSFVNAVFARLLDGDPEEIPYVAAFEALEPARQLIGAADRQPVTAGVASLSEPVSAQDGGATLDTGLSAGGGALPGSGHLAGSGQSPASGLSPDQAIDVVLFHKGPELPEDLTIEQLEAEHVADWILSKIESRYPIEQKGGGTRPIQFGDFAILVSKNDNFERFEEVFSRLGIPYVTSGGKAFLRRQEVSDFENLLRFLDNPNDSHSLLAVLRSPLFPLTDDLIHQIAAAKDNSGERKDDGEKEKVPLWVLLTEAAGGSGSGAAGGVESAGGRALAASPSLKRAVRLLRTILDYASLLPLGELMQKIISLTRYDLVLLAADHGRQPSRNVWKLAQMARANEHMTCGEFAQELADMREFGMKESEAPLDSDDAVKMMTIHNSKGLEFPAVALPCLGGQLTVNPSKLIFHNRFGVAFSTKRQKDDPVPAWYQVASRFDKNMEIEERKRLLYVAMTRARDCLGIFIRREVPKTVESYRKWLLDHLGLNGHDLSLPEEGAAITLTVPPARAETMTRAGVSGAATFGLSYRTLRSQCTAVSSRETERAIHETSLDNMSEEPILNVFEAQVNELALVRLTPSTVLASAGAEDEFAVTSPRVIGTFFHALMENLPRSKNVDRQWVRDIANSQGFHFVHPSRLESFVDEGIRLLEIYYASPFYKLVEGAQSRFSEMPYLLSSAPDLETKRPDLILEAEDGQWYLIDYKTDKFAPALTAAQVRKHRHQLESYVRDLKAISGIELKAALYFAQFGTVEYIS